MVTDTCGFEDHLAVSRRQRRDRAPGVATPAPMRRNCHGWEERQESEGTAGASLSSLEKVSSVLGFTWSESQSTLPAGTEPAGCNAESEDLPAVPKTSVREDAKGFPLTSRFGAVSHLSGHACSDHDADRSRVAVTHLKRDANDSDDLRAWERGSLMAEDSEEQFYCRRNMNCKISTDAMRGREHEERRDSRPAFDRDDEEILNFRSCNSSEFDSRHRSGVVVGGEKLKRDRQSKLKDDRRLSSEKYWEQYSRKGGRRRPKEDRTAGNVHHDYRRVHWRYDGYDDQSAYRGENFRPDYYEPDRFYNRSDQRWTTGASPEKRKEHRFVRAGDWRDYRSSNNRQQSATSAEPCLNEQERRTELAHCKREPSIYSWDSRKGDSFSRHPQFHGVDRSTDVLNYRSCADVSSDYNHGDYGRRRDCYSHCDYASRSQLEGAYYDAFYRNNPAYKQQVDAYCSRLGYSTAQLINCWDERAGPLSADAHSLRSQNFADNIVRDDEPQLQEVHKFPRPHPIACFCGVNGLVKLVPTVSGNKLPQLVELHSLTPLFQKDPDFRELEAFPGPLIRSETHKENVIHYCKNKIASFAEIPDLPDRSSHVLLWELLVVMLRQNGVVSGSEIAELLVRNYETLEPTPSTPCSRPTCDGDADVSSRSSGVCTGSSFDEDIVVCDGSQLGTISTSHVLAKFREYLLFGRKKCALEWAAKHGLWGHALSLASRMDAKTHAAMMTRFTNALSLNDPLRTLYQHLSGRQPAAVPLVATTKWGDWRPHLAMILSNSCPEADARNVTILGDALASHGCLAAAHFCYVVAHVEFGSYSRKSSKLVLLGADHRTLPFRRFASNEAIHCTEIYEYARSLSDPTYALLHLQEYKLLHATRLAEYGFLEEALRYCEVLAVAMARNCVSVPITAQTFELANRLKYHVPQFSLEQTELRKIDEAPWLDVLAQITSKHLSVAENKVALPQAGDNGTLQYDADSEEIRLMAEILSSDSGFQSHPIFTNGSNFFACEDDEYVLRQPEEYFSSYMDNSACRNVSPPVEQQSSVAETQAFAPTERWSPFTTERAAMDASQIQMPADHSFIATHRETVDESSLPQPSTVAQPSDARHFAATCSLSAESRVEVKDQSPLEDSPQSSCSPAGTDPARLDYYSASVYSQCPVTSTHNDHVSGISSSTSPLHTHVRSEHSPSVSEPAKPATDRSREAARKSWLGAIFEKLTPKQPNQIILPDDTDPCIVWDEERKCWVDKNCPPGKTDGPMAPPPTDSSCGGRQNPYSNKQGQNRFHLSKQRSLRRRYVDLLNADSSNSSGDSSLMSTAVLEDQPATTQGASQFFVPQPTSQQCGNSSCDFVSCAPAPDQTSTPAPSLSSEASAHYYWPSPIPAPTPMMFSPTSSTAVAR